MTPWIRRPSSIALLGFLPSRLSLDPGESGAAEPAAPGYHDEILDDMKARPIDWRS